MLSRWRGLVERWCRWEGLVDRWCDWGSPDGSSNLVVHHGTPHFPHHVSCQPGVPREAGDSWSLGTIGDLWKVVERGGVVDVNEPSSRILSFLLDAVQDGFGEDMWKVILREVLDSTGESVFCLHLCTVDVVWNPRSIPALRADSTVAVSPQTPFGEVVC